MCGIAGIVRFDGPIALPELERLCRLMAHRGPDDHGVALDAGPPAAVGFGSQRLSIIDLSTAGHMPMLNAAGDTVITYNGEIFNHAELRAGLEGRGYAYRSRTDTETVLHGYEADGDAFVSKLNGMFAYAIHDRRRQRLVLARDRLGVKPLYFHWDGATLTFASELRTLLSCPWIERRINLAALSFYLTFCYIPSPDTLIEGVRKLPPGHQLTLDLASRELTVRQYWTPALDGALGGRSDAELIAATRGAVTAAIERQMMSDVPLGVLLSGGIDSSIVAIVAQRLRARPIDTFSVGYDGALAHASDGLANQDADFARLVSAQIGSTHHEVRLGDRDLRDLLPPVVAALDEPFCEATSVAQYALARLARQHEVKVLLTGDGADELFGGYGWYQYAQFLERMARVPALAPLLAISGQLFGRTRFGRYARQTHIRLIGAPAQRYQSIYEDFGTFSESEKRGLLAGGLRPGLGADDLASRIRPVLSQAAGASFPDQLAWADLRLWVAEHFNQRLDRVSMLASVEARVPFQDNELVDLALSIPLRRKIIGGERKALLRRAFADVLPEAVLGRVKRPFVGPYESWLRGPLRELAGDVLAPEAVRRSGLLDPDYVVGLRDRFYGGGSVHPAKIWTILILQLWCEIYLTSAVERAHDSAGVPV